MDTGPSNSNQGPACKSKKVEFAYLGAACWHRRDSRSAGSSNDYAAAAGGPSHDPLHGLAAVQIVELSTTLTRTAAGRRLCSNAFEPSREERKGSTWETARQKSAHQHHKNLEYAAEGARALLLSFCSTSNVTWAWEPAGVRVAVWKPFREGIPCFSWLLSPFAFQAGFVSKC